MSAVVYARHDDGSAFYRLREPARVLGVEVVEHLPHVGSAETVVLNRPIEPGLAEQVRLWRAEGRRVVVDMDDDFDAVVPEHHIHGLYTTEHLHAACKAASVVTCSTPALVRRYGYGHGVLIRNRIPESYLSVERRSRTLTNAGHSAPGGTWVGWYGSLGSHPRDPAVAGRAVGEVLNPLGGDAEFVFVGPEKDGPRLREIFGLCRDVRTLGFYALNALPQVLSELDIGIVPLELNPFNEAKSWLKGLELAAVGVPVIASPTSEYRRAEVEGGCWLAPGPLGWRNQLDKLVSKPEWRAEQAERGREWAATQTIEQHADEWRTAWYSHDHATARATG